ncbi:prepilin-type N-terminal cleavage/methylation domain-containing protein [Deinococcus sp. Leaf326]|uniref:prepilin-type N-terminal cleavage/methylation domain-containing protein n=1 Tax=Deinococcus sp. Leaf326 TaxID=1736338 RepID=UPI0006FB5AA2|nr:prepilin-type N-terminal cleavage/methylation domain-containing protein [Deinococcus sp. Leaf326]KQR11258.1 hypothetical protein ASF71_20660 [Deinococcus sp. Leaf326]
MNTSGYTLIEVLIVIGILALVMALVVSRLSRPSDPVAPFAAGMVSYLNSVAADASSREQGACVSLHEGQIVTTPALTPAPLLLPQGVTVNLPEFCYDAKGRVSTAQRLTVASDDASTTADVLIDPGYGNARLGVN